LPTGVAWTWAVITVFAHRIQWGEMLHAGTVAGFGVFVAGLFFYTSRDLRFSLRDKLALALAVFVAVQSSQLTVFPLGLLAVIYGVVIGLRSSVFGHRRITDRRPRTVDIAEWREAATLLGLIALPNLVLVIWYWAIGALQPFMYDVYTFNQLFYSQFLMNGSALGLVHDWEAQYRTYLAMNLAQPSGIDFYLIVAVFGATAITWARRGPIVAILFYLFVALTRVRAEGSYYLSAYLCVALCLVWAIRACGTLLPRQPQGPPKGALIRAGGWDGARSAPRRYAAPVFLILTVVFGVNVLRLYDFTRHPAYRSPFVSIVSDATQPSDRIFVAPYDPYLFLASQRLPATRYAFYFPWQAADPVTEADMIDELRASQAPMVIFMRDELVNAQYPTRVWGARMLAVLQQEYVQLDPDDPVLGDVFVRPDRLADVRARLSRG
jgi:hypothetical protein